MCIFKALTVLLSDRVTRQGEMGVDCLKSSACLMTDNEKAGLVIVMIKGAHFSHVSSKAGADFFLARTVQPNSERLKHLHLMSTVVKNINACLTDAP